MIILKILLVYILSLQVIFANKEEEEHDGIAFPSIDLKTPLFKLNFYEKSNNLFVGGRNYIFSLSAELQLLESFKTNNLTDADDCYPGQRDCKNASIPNNDNQALLIKTDQKPYDFLFACGTAYKGMCYISKLSPLDGKLFGAPNVTSNYAVGARSTVALFATVPYANVNPLFVGAQYDGRPPQFNIPAISARIFKLKPPRLSFVGNGHDTVAKVELKGRYKTHQIRFLYAFEDTNFVYFLTTQPVGESGDVETKLGRICKEDQQFFSYMEIPLVCSNNDVGYNLATTAYMENSSGQETGHLYVTFVLTEKGTANVNKAKGSVVCSYDLFKVLNKEFGDAIKSCMNGNAHAKLLTVFNGEERKCSASNLQDPVNFTGSGINPYIAGSITVHGDKVAYLPSDIVSSMAVSKIAANDGAQNVIILGTEDGKLVKVLPKIKGEDKVLFTKSVSNALIRPDPVFDSTKNNLYFATGTRVVKFPSGSCSIYTDCRTCLLSADPLNCGWCGTRCAHEAECENGTHLERFECPPEIRSFTPKNGSITGGTELVIFGADLGHNSTGISENTNLTVNVANVKCLVTFWSNKLVKCKTGAVEGPVEGKIEVYVVDRSQENGHYDIYGIVTSRSYFSYFLPVVHGLKPHFGPVSGGTKVTVYGQHLNIGAKREVILNGVNCVVANATEDGIECITGPNTIHSGNATIVIIDDQPLTSNLSFIYKSDPRFVKIEHVTSIAKGGMNVTVFGHYLNHVAEPKMIVRFFSPQKEEIARLVSDCVVENNGTVMNCKTPKLPKHLNHHRRDTTVQALASFDMDGSEDFKSIGPNRSDSVTLLYFSNPEFKKEAEIREINLNEPVLVINGENLSNKYKVRVLLENDDNEIRDCFVEDSTDTRMFCRIDATDEDLLLSSDWQVSVIVVDDLFAIGTVRFIRGSGFSRWAIVLIVLCILILLVAIALLILKSRGIYPFVKKNINYQVAYHRDGQPDSPFARQGSQNEYIGTCAMRERNANDPLLNGASSMTVVAEQTMALLAHENILIAREYLNLGKIIGKGCFGTVYKGELTLPGKDEAIEVAVKTLHNTRGNGQNIDCESFLQEGLMMKDFKHENVLSLIGVCLETNQSPMVILPFMANGDLLTYVRDEENVVTVKDLMLFGIQVAEGMSYLASCKFVHRDLAARNCMIDKNKIVKVADFGLARDIYERDYYSSDHMKTKLPVKWMAPESLEKGIYDTKTDVWSFGVLLWEIMTRGVTPYPQVDNWDILTYLKQGNRMLRPEFCPEMLYDIMLRCWNDNPKARPAFSGLVTEVRDVITKLESKSGQQKVGLNVQYVNYPPSKYYNVSGAEGGETSGVTPV